MGWLLSSFHAAVLIGSHFEQGGRMFMFRLLPVVPTGEAFLIEHDAGS